METVDFPIMGLSGSNFPLNQSIENIIELPSTRQADAVKWPLGDGEWWLVRKHHSNMGGFVSDFLKSWLQMSTVKLSWVILSSVQWRMRKFQASWTLKAPGCFTKGWV